MNGRIFFKRYIVVIRIMQILLSFLPRVLISFFYSIVSSGSSNFLIFVRFLLLSRLCKHIGPNFFSGPNIVFKHIEKLSLGENVSIHAGCYLDANGFIEIGDNVSIAHMSSIISFDHSYDNANVPIKYNPLKLKKVIINNDVWIGCGARILSGVNIGSRSIVAAGAVVTCDVPENTIVAGVPARVIKRIN